MFNPFRFLTRHWVLGGMSFSVLPLLLFVMAWFLYLLEPGCFDGMECSAVGSAFAAIFYVALGGFFLIVLPMTAPIARALPSINEGNFILGVMFLMILGNFILGAWVASSHRLHIMTIARQKRWFAPGMLAVWVIGTFAILSTYQVLYKNPWLSVVAICMVWALYIFYVLLCVVAGEYAVAILQRLSAPSTKVQSI